MQNTTQVKQDRVDRNRKRLLEDQRRGIEIGLAYARKNGKQRLVRYWLEMQAKLNGGE